jgi:hypothetical protein
MLYDSTKSLLYSILRALEVVDDTGWDDQTESGNSCLYEMPQTAGSLDEASKSERLNHHLHWQCNLPTSLIPAISLVRTMVTAIRHKDQARAVKSGKAALAVMNGFSIISGGRTEPTTESKVAAVVRQEKPTRKGRRLVKGRHVLAPSGI